jgi:hypothetical protein
VKETVDMSSRREGNTKKYTQACGPWKTYPTKILLTAETIMTIAMGIKTATIVSA